MTMYKDWLDYKEVAEWLVLKVNNAVEIRADKLAVQLLASALADTYNKALDDVLDSSVARKAVS